MADRLQKLKDLESRLYSTMEDCDEKTLASIAKQYRETIREIDEIEGGVTEDDEIGAILQAREVDGKSNAVRKSRSKVQRK